MISGNLGAWGRARKLLCVRLDSMGDVLMTTPAIAALKESLAGREITLLTSEGGAAAARLVPDIDDVIVYDSPWMKSTVTRTDPELDEQMIARLRDRHFDAAVIFTVVTQSALPAAVLCFLAGIPLRLAHCREKPYQLLTDWLPDGSNQGAFVHETQRQIDLVGFVGATTKDERLRVEVSEDADRRVQKMLDASSFDLERPWLVLHPGASAASRRYPPEAFATIVRLLREAAGVQTILTGSENERDTVAWIQGRAGVPTTSLAGALDLGMLAALISRACLLISNNTGPVHIAAAVGTPVVDLYAMTNPEHTPWLVASRVLTNPVDCGYCFKSVCVEGHHACLRGIAPERVLAAAVELLTETGGARQKGYEFVAG